MGNDNTLYQVSLLQGIVNGYYDGVTSIERVKEFGDVGIGTFDCADGELIMIDSKAYKAKVDGTVDEMPDSSLTPFCNVCKFITNDTQPLNVSNIKELKTMANRYRNMYCKNMFIAFRISGVFKKMVVRSIPKQNKPYNPLEYLVENEQKIYEYQNISGTLIGFLFPRFMKDLNTLDCHMHFISKDKKHGGHVLDLEAEGLTVEISIKSEFNLILTNTNSFNKQNFAVSTSTIKKVEE